MPGMTPDQEAGHALDFGVARSDLSKEAQVAYDRLAEQRARAAAAAPVSRAVVLDSVRVAEKNMRSFAVTGWHDRLYLAWVPSYITYRIDLAYSTDGREIMGRQKLAQRNQGLWGNVTPSPSLAVSGEQLYLAWTDTLRRINILADPQSPPGAPVRVDQYRSPHTLALCSHQGSLVLAWTVPDGRIAILADPQSSHDWPVRLEDTRSKHGPALCSHQDSLVLAWTGTDTRINILADPQGPLDRPVLLKEAWTKSMPALCSHQGSLVLAWTDTDSRINILADPQGPHGAPARLEEARSYFGPALCTYQGSLILAWCGKDGHLNLARLEWT